MKIIQVPVAEACYDILEASANLAGDIAKALKDGYQVTDLYAITKSAYENLVGKVQEVLAAEEELKANPIEAYSAFANGLPLIYKKLVEAKAS